MRIRLTELIALTVCSGLIAAGCGGDDGGNDGGAKEDYIAKGDEICQQAKEEREQAAEEQLGADGVPDPAAAQRFFENTTIPNLKAQMAELRRLKPPPGDERTVDEVYDAADRAIAQVEEGSAAAPDPNAAEVFTEANRRFKEYGFEVCGEGG